MYSEIKIKVTKHHRNIWMNIADASYVMHVLSSHKLEAVWLGTGGGAESRGGLGRERRIYLGTTDTGRVRDGGI